MRIRKQAPKPHEEPTKTPYLQEDEQRARVLGIVPDAVEDRTGPQRMVLSKDGAIREMAITALVADDPEMPEAAKHALLDAIVDKNRVREIIKATVEDKGPTWMEKMFSSRSE